MINTTSIISNIPYIVMALGVFFGLIFTWLACRGQGFMDEVSRGGRNFSLDNFKIQLGFTEGLPAGSLGWILSFYAGHSDFMLILLLDKIRSKE